MQSYRRLLAVGFALGVPLLLIAPALQPGYVLSAADGLLDSYLLAEARPAAFERSNQLLTDAYRQFIPWRSLSSAEVLAGRMPFWNPYAYAGSPLLGNAQSAVFDPLAVPYLLAPSQPEHATVWVSLLRLWTAALGTLFLARKLGCNWPGAALAAVVYAGGGFAVVWLLSPHTSTSAWIPWSFLAAERLVEKPDGSRAAGLAAALSLALFGGHVEIAFLTATAITAYVVVRCGQRRGSRSAAMPALYLTAAGLLCVAITAVQTVPFLEALQQGLAAHDRAGAFGAASLMAGFRPERLVAQVFPYVMGRPLAAEVGFWTPASNFNDLVPTYGSFLGLVLAGLALARPRPASGIRALCLVGLVAWAFHVGIPPLGWVWQRLPVVGLAPPERTAPLALCTLAVLAGWGLTRASAHDSAPHAARWLARVAAGAGITAAGFGLDLLWGGGTVSLTTRLLDSDWGRGVLGGQATGVMAGLAEAAPIYGARYVLPWCALVIASAIMLRGLARGMPAARWGVVAIAAVDLLYLGTGYNPAIPADQVFPETPAIADLRAATGSGRALMLEEGLPANAATRYRLLDVQGYDVIDRSRLGELLALSGEFSRFSSLRESDHWVYDVLSVRAVTTRTPRHEPSRPLSDGFLHHNTEALPLVFAPATIRGVPGREAAAAAMQAADFNPHVTGVVEGEQAPPARFEITSPLQRPSASSIHFTVQVSEPGWLFVSEGYDPGWTATQNGAPISLFPADLAIIGLQVDTGSQTLELRFRPRWWSAALAATVIGLALAVILLIGGASRGRGRPTGRVTAGGAET